VFLVNLHNTHNTHKKDKEDKESMKPLLTNAQVCELLKISPATLTRWIRAGKIPHVLLSTGKTKLNVRFVEAEIESWITRRSRGPGGGSTRVASSAQPSSNANATATGNKNDTQVKEQWVTQ
jgi:excisionase family DNA binding protein